MQQRRRILTFIALIILAAAVAFLARSPRPAEAPSTAGFPGAPAATLTPGGDVAALDVEYGEGHHGYLARPADAGVHPGVILIHEWWGLNDHIRDMARRFAEQGYVALAVNLYDTEATTDPAVARELTGAVQADTVAAFANLADAVAYLKRQPYVAQDRLASVGWCFGGGWSYQMAKNDLGTRASVMYYGRFMPEDDLSHMRADILGHFGEKDTGILVDDVREFQAKLATLAGDHAVYIYPNAGHAFANDTGANYDPEAAELAWQRTLEFLARELGE